MDSDSEAVIPILQEDELQTTVIEAEAVAGSSCSKQLLLHSSGCHCCGSKQSSSPSQSIIELNSDRMSMQEWNRSINRRLFRSLCIFGCGLTIFSTLCLVLIVIILVSTIKLPLIVISGTTDGNATTHIGPLNLTIHPDLTFKMRVNVQ